MTQTAHISASAIMYFRCRCTLSAHRIWLAVVLASRLPCGQPTTHIASTTGSTAGSIIEAHLSDDDAGNNNGGSRSGPVSLLEKYTFRETVRTVIDEDSLPELPDFLESINLGDRLEVSSRPFLTHDGFTRFQSTWAERSWHNPSTWE